VCVRGGPSRKKELPRGFNGQERNILSAFRAFVFIRILAHLRRPRMNGNYSSVDAAMMSNRTRQESLQFSSHGRWLRVLVGSSLHLFGDFRLGAGRARPGLSKFPTLSPESSPKCRPHFCRRPCAFRPRTLLILTVTIFTVNTLATNSRFALLLLVIIVRQACYFRNGGTESHVNKSTGGSRLWRCCNLAIESEPLCCLITCGSGNETHPSSSVNGPREKRPSTPFLPSFLPCVGRQAMRLRIPVSSLSSST
jgi:hypothetical protein